MRHAGLPDQSGRSEETLSDHLRESVHVERSRLLVVDIDIALDVHRRIVDDQLAAVVDAEGRVSGLLLCCISCLMKEQNKSIKREKNNEIRFQ